MARQGQGIARRIALAGVIISTASGIGLGGASAIGEFRRSFDLALHNTDRVLQAAAPQLERTYWDIDLIGSQSILDRLAEDPLIQSLSVRDLVLSPEQMQRAQMPRLGAASDGTQRLEWPVRWLVPQAWLSDRREVQLVAPRSGQPIAQLQVTLSFVRLYDDLWRRALGIIGTTVLQALLIAAIMFGLTRRLVITPLNALSRAALALRDGGKFELAERSARHFSTRREDEIASLARDFALTVDRMEHYRDNLRDEVEQRTAELVVARNDALAASRAKSAFLANMSHELRTPLNAITGLSELMLAERLPAASRRHLVDMQSAARQLLGSIDNVLDLSKLEAGQMVFETVRFPIEEVFDEVLAQTRALIGSRPVALEGEIAPDVPDLVWGDRQKLTQILLNLASNAVKFTQRGRIRLRIWRRGPVLRLAVMDSGKGINPGDQKMIFAPFSQADDSTSRRVSGTGLGLSIARQMAEGMGGSLTLRSRPGRGSLFVLNLPLRGEVRDPSPALPRPRLDLSSARARRRLRRMLARLPLEPVESDITIRPAADGFLLTRPDGSEEALPQVLTHRELRDAMQHLQAGPALESVEALALRERRVLLIEDREINRTVIESLLRRAHARVASAPDGRSALTVLAMQRPDVILTDLHMPDLDGLATLREMRARGFGDIPVVASSADVSTETRLACREAGFADFLPKPVTGAALTVCLSTVLEQAVPVLDHGMLDRNTAGDDNLKDHWLAMLPAEIESWRKLLAGALPLPEALHAIRGSAAQLGAAELHAVCAEDPVDLRRITAALDRLAAGVPQVVHHMPATLVEDPAQLRAECVEALGRNEMRGFDLLDALLPHLPQPLGQRLAGCAERLDFRRATALLEDQPM
ncbi:ATP-binding protein [Paracoccus sp. NGMCC 1.201697]|uniref:histidine kinase n=1 Tax=Paracoccus broussonetiae subsp. drimophilus TaxID=3373869 RepID=A0ABW7LQK6_9RHOB